MWHSAMLRGRQVHAQDGELEAPNALTIVASGSREQGAAYGALLRPSQQASNSSRCPTTSPATTGGPPPCILSARTVATMTTALGASPLARHLMLKNFSIPMSAPKPACENEWRWGWGGGACVFVCVQWAGGWCGKGHAC